MSRRERLFLAISALFFAFALNYAFLDWVSPPKVLAMNDVPAILRGYRQTPNLLLDGLRWWNGSWIHQDVGALRPLASYLYWIDCWLGLRFGFIWPALIGALLLTINSLLAGALAWRWTRSKLCAYLATGLGVSLRFHNWSGTTPDYWLAWFPVQDNLLFCTFLLGGVLCFDKWMETARRLDLMSAWVLGAAACLTKEYGYIFPVFALALALWKQNPRVERKWALLHAILMGAGVLALWFYRAAIIIDPRNPTLKRIHLIRKPWLYLFYPFYKHVLTEEFWLPGLALWLMGLGSGVLRWSRSRYADLLQKPYVPIGVAAGLAILIAIYCTLTYGSFVDALWYIFDPATGAARAWQLLDMMATIYAVWLLWKYRKTEPTLLAFAFLAISYLPVVTYLGWHYTVAAWFVRCAYWAVVFKCAWLDISPLLLPRLQKLKKYQPAFWAARPKSSPA